MTSIAKAQAVVAPITVPLDLEKCNALTQDGKLCRNKKTTNAGSCHVVNHQPGSVSGMLALGQSMADHINLCVRQGIPISFASAKEYVQQQLTAVASPMKKQLSSELRDPSTPNRETASAAIVRGDPLTHMSALLDDVSMSDSSETPDSPEVPVTVPVVPIPHVPYASPVKPMTNDDCQRHYYHKYPSLTPAEIDEIRAPLRDTRQRVRRVLEVQTAWRAAPVVGKTIASSRLAAQVASQQKELEKMKAALIETRQGVEAIMDQLPRFMETMRIKTEDHEQVLQQCVAVQETMSFSMTDGTC